MIERIRSFGSTGALALGLPIPDVPVLNRGAAGPYALLGLETADGPFRVFELLHDANPFQLDLAEAR
jgi:hypothetical protein